MDARPPDRPRPVEPLPAVDRAAFAVALAGRLRRHGVAIGFTAVETFIRALVAAGPSSSAQMYWTARISFVKHGSDIETFDAVFAQVFGDATLAVDPHARRDSLGRTTGRTDDTDTTGHGGEPEQRGNDDALPWATLPSVVADAEPADGALVVPVRRPSPETGLADLPFEHLDATEMALMGDWLRATVSAWPVRRSRRRVPDRRGDAVAMRETLRQARRTGWEPVHLARTRAKEKPRRVVLLCDVSQSMHAQATAYLHLMRALALQTHTEVFAFATTLTRLTSVLNHRSAEQAIDRASSTVTDRFGGTRIATNLRAVLSAPYTNVTRGAVVLIASDGWDSDPPGELARAMARLQRRAHRVLWLNPRAGAPGFEPKVAAMAAALPHCDTLLPADTFQTLHRAIAAIASSTA